MPSDHSHDGTVPPKDVNGNGLLPTTFVGGTTEPRPKASWVSQLERALEEIRFARRYHTEQALHHHDIASLLALKEQRCVEQLHGAGWAHSIPCQCGK